MFEKILSILYRYKKLEYYGEEENIQATYIASPIFPSSEIRDKIFETIRKNEKNVEAGILANMCK